MKTKLILKMYKQNYVCCKSNCCKQENTQWKNGAACKNYTKDSRNRNCVTGAPKGFVQNLKDKLTNLQNENQFKPVKKKQKDYHYLMLRKINNLDKKLQNLENLFISHLNHTPNEAFNSNDNEPLCDYMNFYESVRSLVDLASRLKEDILCKQCDSHIPDRNTLHLNDRIQVLDSELQNLYTHLDRLQNCRNDSKGEKQFFIQDYQDEQYCYEGFRGGPKGKNMRCSDFMEVGKQNKNKRKYCRPTIYDEDSCNSSSSYCVECCCEADEESTFYCQCSKCKVNATVCKLNPGNRRSPKIYEHCPERSVIKNTDCCCDLCVPERKKKLIHRNNNLWLPETNSSCSCEICSNKSKSKNTCNQNCSTKIKMIKPVDNGEYEENFLSEFEISCREVESSKNSVKKKQQNQWRRQSLNEDIKNNDLETKPHQSLGLKEQNSITPSEVKLGGFDNPEHKEERFTKSHYSKRIAHSNNQDVRNVVYYELSPNLNVVTKKKNRIRQLDNTPDFYREKNKNNKKNKNNFVNFRNEYQRNNAYRLKTINYNLREESPSNKYTKRVVKSKRNPYYYSDNDQTSSETEHMNNFYKPDISNKKNTSVQNDTNKSNCSPKKHLHITFCKKKACKERQVKKQNMKRAPQNRYKYKNNDAELYHRKHGGHCHFHDGKETFTNRRSPYYRPYNVQISESDSFETVQDESDSDSSSSQYKLFFCDDPNCVEKLDSDELIMLMSKTDLKNCSKNPCKINISEKVNDLKSDVCEGCTMKEKTISVTPHKVKNRNVRDKGKIIYQEELVECHNCKTHNTDHLSEIKTNKKYVNSEITRELEDNNRSSSTNNKRNMKSHYQEDVEDDTGSSGDNRNKRETKGTKNKPKMEKDSESSIVVGHNGEKSNKAKTGVNKTWIVASSSIDRSSVNSKRSKKAVEVPGFGNLININIERGPYPLNQEQPNVVSIQKPDEETTSLTKSTSNRQRNKNENINSRMDGKEINIESQIVYATSTSVLDPVGNVFSPEENVLLDNTARNRSDYTQPQPSLTDKSISVMDLVDDRCNSKEIKVEAVKSEMFTNSVDSHNSSNRKDDLHEHLNKDTNIEYAGGQGSGMVRENNDKTLFSKKNYKNSRNDRKLNMITEENLGNVPYIQDSRIYENRYIRPKIKQIQIKSVSKKNIVKPRVSTTRVKRSRLKFNKKFGPCLSKVSSAHSIIVERAKLYPYENFPLKKGNIFKENSFSGILKPQVKIVVQESYQNDLIIPSNDCSNSRYKVASISNYLSSTEISDSSYSTINWEKVAQKLKDDHYLNNVV